MSNPMNSTARKIHNLLSSGAVTVTGPSQPRNMKARINAAGSSGGNATTISTSNVNSRCYICDDILSTGTSKSLMVELETSHTNTRFPKKISQLAGPGIKVVVGPSDIVCSRCTNLINYLDRLENDVERVRTNLLNLMNKKYNLFTDVETAKINAKSGNANSTISNTNNNNTNSSNVSTSDHGHVSAPPIKMQKLNTGSGVARVPQTMSAAVHDDASGVGTSVNEPTRKTAQNTLNTAAASTPAKSPVSAVQQLRINTPSSTTLQQSSSGTTSPTSSPQSNSGSSPINTPQRKSTKIYKCLMCDYRTSDMRLFNTHFESCKNQNFQCKNCRKIFPNFGSLKGHMVRDHNTSMDNTCAVCHVNFVSDLTLRKHMETTHATNVVVTSTSTLLPTTGGSSVTAHVPASPTHEAATTTLHDGGKANVTTTTGGSVTASTANNNNNNNVANRLKPFKCRICAQRFETRDAATTHAKLHQPNFFKCGVCSLSFSKREMLVKHFAEHDHNQQQQLHQLQQQQQSQKSSINSNNAQQQQQRNIKLQQQQQQQQQMQEDQQQLTTQKLLQDTIDEALSISGSNQQQQQLHNNATTITSTGIGSTMITTTTTSSNMSNNDTTGDSGDEQSSGGGNNNNNIRFFSCQVCSLTFIQKNYYTQHMETHRREGMIDAAGTNNNANNNKKTVATGNGVTVTAIGQNKNINVSNNNQQQQHQQQTPRRGGGVGSLNAAAVALLSDDVQEPRIATSKLAQRSKLGQGNRVSIGGTGGGISDADIESIFEKMHSEKNENSVGGTRNATLSPAPSSSSSASSAAGKIKITKKNASIPNKGPVVISTHGGASSGGISFNISIPGTETTSVGNSQRKSLAATTNSISIDMPALDTPDDGMKVNDINGGDSSGTNSSVGGGGGGGVGHLSSVSMPSLDDDGSDAAHATPSSSSNIGHHHHHQQQQKQMSGDTSVGFGTHKLDELAAAAEDSSAAQQAAAQLAESGIHHVAAAAVAAAAADEAAAAAAEAAEHKLLDISMDEQELEQQQHQQMDMTDAEQQQMHEQQQLQDQLDHDQQQQQLEHEQQQQQQQLEQQLEHEQQQLDDDEHQQHNVDGTNGAEGGTEMDLEEAMQAQVDSGQIKFILNENGQLLQLDNHIITDADGNQILVQDPEQIQQLLQSVGVLQSGDGLDGETIQMMTDANGQMVLVQGGEHNETQLIDASLLNSDGQLVIQQGQDGELGEGAHVIGEDGTRIPVSVSYTADGQPIVQVHNQMLQASDVDVDDQQHQQQLHHQHHHVLQQAGKDGVSELSVGDVDMHDEDDEGVNSGNGDGGGGLTTTSGAFLALEELMQQQHTGIDAKHSNE